MKTIETFRLIKRMYDKYKVMTNIKSQSPLFNLNEILCIKKNLKKFNKFQNKIYWMKICWK